MPKPVTEIHLTDWIQQILDTSNRLPNSVWSIYWEGKQRRWKAINIQYETGTQKARELDAYYLTGNEEMLRDIKGINTVVSITDLFSKPSQTLWALGKKTVDDLGNMEEAAADRMSQTVGALTKGKLSRPDKANYDDPDSGILWVAKKMGLGITSTDGIIEKRGGRAFSRIQMIGSPNVVGADPNEDRYIAEETASGSGLGSGRSDHAPVKAYKSLAGSIGGMVGQIDNPSGRTGYYKTSLLNYGRATAQELGVDINYATLNRRYSTTSGTSALKGGIYNELVNKKAIFTSADNLDNLLSDKNRISSALGINISTWDGYSDTTKGFLKSHIKQEVLSKYTDYAAAGVFDPNSVLSKYGKAVNARLPDVIENERLRLGVENQLISQASLAQLKNDVIQMTMSVEERKLVGQWNRAHGTAYTSLDQFSRAGIVSATDVINQRNQFKAKSQRAWSRMDDSARAMELGQRMYFYGTISDLMESIESGSFVKTAIIGTRMIGLFPLLAPDVGGLNSLLAPVDKFTDLVDKTFITPAKTLLLTSTGLVYEGDAAKLTGPLNIVGKRIMKESATWVDWQETTVTRAGKRAIKTHAVYVKAKDAKGLFGAFSAFDITDQIFAANGSIFDDIPGLRASTLLSSADNLFLNSNPLAANSPLNIELLMEKLRDAANDIAGGGRYVHTPLHDLAKYLKLDDPSNLAKLNIQIASMNATGREFLSKSLSAHGLQANGRWTFLNRIKQQGKIPHFLNSHMGLFNLYNRWANGLNSFLYDQIVWGQYAGNNLLIKLLINASTPLRAVLRSSGFADGMTLMEWVDTRFTSKVSGFFTKLAANPSQAFGRLGSNRLFAGTFGRVLSGTVARSLALIGANVGAVATAGISYLIAAVSELAFSVGKNILYFRFNRIASDLKEIAIKKLNTVKKITYFIVCCGCLIIIVPVFIIVAIVGLAIAPLEGMGGGSSSINLSQKIKVTKTSTVATGTDVIKYKIKVESIARDANNVPIPAKIISVKENILYTGGCAAGATVDKYFFTSEDGGAYGKFFAPTDNDTDGTNDGYTNALLQVSNFPPEINPGDPITIEYELRGIKTSDGTYVNNIEIAVEGESGKNAFDSAITNIGVGGCILCPAEWPTSGTISQGPGASYSHSGEESLDISSAYNAANPDNSGTNTKIYATHAGIAVVVPESAQCPPLKNAWLGACAAGGSASECSRLETQMYGTCGLGYHIFITSSDGNYTTKYGHLSNASITSGSAVEPGVQIGTMGSSGYSTGVHLHYQFVSNTSSYYNCNGTDPLRMAPPYIPLSVPRCVGEFDCAMTINTMYD